ncbi:MAG: hypothetical protein ABW136_00125 [Steroidobacteraceae bacterium]
MRAIAWALLLVLLVAAGLHFAPLVRQGVETSTRVLTTLTLLEQTREALDRDGPTMRSELDRRLGEARSLGEIALTARRSDLRTELAAERARRRPDLHRKAAWLTGAGLAQDLENDARITLLETELTYLDALALRIERVTARQSLLRRLYVDQLYAWQRLQEDQRGLCPASAVRWYDLTFTPAEVRRCEAYRVARQAYVDELAHPAVIEVPAPPDTSGLLAAITARFEPRRAELQRALDEHSLARHIDGIRRRLPEAVTWLALALVTSLGLLLGLRAFAYFVIAPFVGRRASVRLHIATTGPMPAERGRISAVSQAVIVDADHELLVHHRFLQSVETSARMRTRWLLSWRYPFTSLASRLVALTSIRSTETASFTISATEGDAISEIGLVTVPEGGAMVLQPRCLVGVLQRHDLPMRITRHWRLGTLSAWLTLQLRYLAFHGPATLLVHGSRGVRLEVADAGRAISRAATLGFGADVAYSQVRTETFVPYLLGRQPLFNDRFSGEGGLYLSEETTGMPGERGAASRRLGGLFDALLKIFGI